MATKIQIRRDTAANWTSVNPTLSSGELGYEIDTDKVKVGDGTTAWTSLAYLIDPSSVVSNLVEDITPQLGGNLDVNDKLIYNDTGTVKLQAGTADYVTIVNSAGADRIRFSDTGGMQALGWYHSFGDSSATRGYVNIMGSDQGFDPGSGTLRILNGTSSAGVALTVPTALSGNYVLTLPGADGTNGQVLTTDGSGNLSFATPAAGGISNLVEDTTPQLGGELDTNGNNIRLINGTLSMQAGANSGSIYGANVYLGNLLGTAGFLNIEGDGAGTAGRLTATGDITLNSLVYPSADGTNGQVLTTDGSGNLSFADAAAAETTTTLTGDSVNQKLVFTDETGTSNDIDLSWAVDDTNLARITSGSVDGGTGIATFSRDDASTFTVDFSALFDDTNLARINSGTLSGTTLTLIRTDFTGLDVDLSSLDSRYQPAGTYNTIIGTDSDINTSGSTIIDNIFVTDGVIQSMGTRTLTPADIGALSTSVANQSLNTTSSPTFAGLNINGSLNDVSDIYLGNRLFSDQDSNTFLQFTNLGTEWRVITGGGERFRVDNSNVTVQNDLIVNGGDITLNGTGRIQGVDTILQDTDAANKLYVDNAVASAGGGISNLVEDTTPQLGGNLDLNGNYIGHANAYMRAYDFGTGSQFAVYMQGELSPALQIYANPGSSIADVTIKSDLTVSGGDITLGGTGRIQGIDTVSANTDAANKLYVDNAVASAGGGISNVVEDTTPQLGGNLDIGGNYVGLPNAYIDAVDFGTGAILNFSSFGNTIFQLFSAPGPSSQSATLTADLEIRDTFDLQFENNNSIVQRHCTRGVTELFTRYSSTPSSIFVDVGSNGDTNIHWISTNLTSNVKLNVVGITGANDPSVSINTISVIAYCNVTDYIVNDIDIDGFNYSIRWAGGSAPVPTTGGNLNLFTFTIIYDDSFPVPQVLGAHQGF